MTVCKIIHIHAGCPTLMRCDYGTENCLVGTAHIAFRLDAGADEDIAKRSFLYGTSPANTVRT